MAGMFGTSAYGANPYMRFSALMGRNPFNPYGDDGEEDGSVYGPMPLRSAGGLTFRQPPSAQNNAAMGALASRMANINQQYQRPNPFSRGAAQNQLGQRNAYNMQAMAGGPIQWDPITQPSRGRLPGGGYGGNVPDPTYGNLGLGSVGVQTPQQYLAPGRRNPFYGPYISGGKINPGQMTNFVAGRLQAPGAAGSVTQNPFGGQQPAPAAPTARQQAISQDFADNGHRYTGDNPAVGMTFKASPGMQDYIARAKEQQMNRVAAANEFRQQNRAAQAAAQKEYASNPFNSIGNYMMDPNSPHGAEHNRNVLAAAGNIFTANNNRQQQEADRAFQRDIADRQARENERRFGLQEQDLADRRAQREADAANKTQAQKDQQTRFDKEMVQKKIDHHQQLLSTLLALQAQNPDQDYSGQIKWAHGQLQSALGEQGGGMPPAGPNTPPGPGPGAAPPGESNPFAGNTPVFDPSKMHDLIGATADMPDSAAYQHATKKGVNSTHLDQYIAQNMNPSSWLEGSEAKALRLRRLHYARRLRGMYPNPPANPNAPLAPPGQQPQPDPMAGMFPSNPGF